MNDGIAPQFDSTQSRRSPMQSRAQAALASISSGAGFVGVIVSLATQHPSFLPLGQRLQHRRHVEHSQPARADAGQAPRVGFAPQPSRRKSCVFRQLMQREKFRVHAYSIDAINANGSDCDLASRFFTLLHGSSRLFRNVARPPASHVRDGIAHHAVNLSRGNAFGFAVL